MRSESSLLEHVVRDSIPAKVYLTGPWPSMPNDLEALQQTNEGSFPPGTLVSYFTDAQMAASAKQISTMLASENVTASAYSAFSNLRPGAFRADLWRYMILWAYGGVYYDAKIALTAPLTKWINFNESHLYLVQDRTPRGYWNAIMASPPRSPLLAEAIKHVVRNVQQHSYGAEDALRFDRTKDNLAITGPLALSASIQASVERGLAPPVVNAQLTQDLRIRALPPETGEVAHVVDSLHRAGHHCGGEEDLPCPQGVEDLSYGGFFGRHQVYCDEPGMPCSHALSTPPL